MTVVEQIAAGLTAGGTQHVWGVPGGDTLSLVAALADVGLPAVLVRHEGSAGFAADASAQLTGGTGACVATLGPGLTNLLTGVAGCLLDRAPVIALTSCYPPGKRASYTHMMLDQTALMRPVSKAVHRMTAGSAAAEVTSALRVAHAHRPGPVFLEVPTDIATSTSEGAIHMPTRTRTTDVDPALVDRIRHWRRPAILVGFAARHAGVSHLAAALRAPVLTTYKAKGAIGEGTGWSAGAAGLSPVIDAVHQELLAGCDGILLLGWDPAELRDHWMPGWPPDAEVVVVDEGDVTDIPGRVDAVATGRIDALTALLAIEGASTWELSDIARHRDTWRAPLTDDGTGPVTALRGIERGATGAIVTLDVGAHRITAANTWTCATPDRLLQSNGLSSMGYGLPAAIAATALGHRAVSIIGDAGLQMTLGELMTAAERAADLTVVVLDDRSLSLIALKQRRLRLPAAMVGFANPDWHALGAAVGAPVAVVDPAEAEAAVREAVATPGPALVAVRVDRSHYAQHM
jgi:acetolactate synthase-1/2/3 large subunit